MPGIEYLGAGALANTGTTTVAVDYPAPAGGLLPFDFLVAMIGISTTTAPSGSGWNARVGGDSAGVSPYAIILTKFAAGGETGNFAFTTVSRNRKAIMLGFRGVDPVNPVIGTGLFQSSAAVTAYDVTSIANLVPGCALCGIAAANASSGSVTPPTTPAAWTEVSDTTGGVVPNVEMAYLLNAPAGGSGVIDFVRSGAIRGAAAAIALRPAGSPPFPHPLTRLLPILAR